MKEDKLLNELFESARTEEPKVSYEEMAGSFTKTVPATGVLDSVKELLLNNISLNSVLVVVTSGVLLTGALIMSSPTKAVQNEEAISQSVIVDENSNSETPTTHITKEVFVEPEELEEIKNNTNTTEQIKQEKTKPIFPKTKKIEKKVIEFVPEKIVETSSPEPQRYSESQVIPVEKEDKESEVQEDAAQRNNISKSPSNNFLADKPLSNKINATNGYNEPFTGYGTNLKKLKRNLLNKLINDGFIESKKDDVIIEIEEKQVVINGVKVKPYLYTKYTSTVQDFEIVPEKNRQIRITDDMILVGDFTDQGFRGKGEGYNAFMYLPDFQKDIQLGAVSIDLSPIDFRKSKVSFDEQIMQDILDLNQFEHIFKKDKRGQYLPLTLLTNDHFSDNLPLHFQGQPIKLIRGEASLSANAGLPIIYMKKYRFGSKKATVKFLYDGYEISVSLKRFNNDWLMKRFQVTGKKENQIDVKF